ncbi:hypothetical protein PTI98_010679 [Pleurotus ostreatus]|nr:hypothetical protein PTI98_010679 [Pleurotus ostreatus]
MLSGVLSSSPMLNLAAATGSFPFPTKFIALPPDAKVTLGLEQPAATSSRKAENMNGWFPHKQPSASGSNPIAPLPLSTAHAEVWSQGGKIFIRDLDSPFGTYVNDIKITGPTQLKRGDIIVRAFPPSLLNRTRILIVLVISHCIFCIACSLWAFIFLEMAKHQPIYRTMS